MEESLDKVIDDKIKPMLDKAMSEYLGVKISEIKEDITDRLKKSPLLDITIDTSIPFKKAKDLFKKNYIIKLLRLKYGNVSEVARILNLDRRSIHRLIKKFKIDIDRFRKEMMKADYIKQGAVNTIIEKTLDNYKQVINTSRLDNFYKNIDHLSKEIISELPIIPLTLKEAEDEFEKAYILKALKENSGNISKTAKKIGLRFETLHRKIKALTAFASKS